MLSRELQCILSHDTKGQLRFCESLRSVFIMLFEGTSKIFGLTNIENEAEFIYADLHRCHCF